MLSGGRTGERCGRVVIGVVAAACRNATYNRQEREMETDMRPRIALLNTSEGANTPRTS